MADPLAPDSPLSFFTPSSPMVTAPNSLPPAWTATPAAPAPVVPGQSPTDLELKSRMDEAFRREEESIDVAKRGMALQERQAGERERELEPIRQRQLEVARQPLPQAPRLRQPPEKPQAPNTQDAEAWLFASSLLGALAGAFTRNHQTNALAAFTGAMQGYAEGSQQKFDNNMKLWEAENKRAQEANENALTEYRDILENRKLSLEQMSVELQVAASKHEDRAMATAAKTKNALTIAQLYDTQAKALEQMRQSSERMEMAQARIDAARIRRGGVQMSDDAVDMRANLWLEGNPLALRGVKAGSEDYANISSRMAELAKERGLSAADITKLQTKFVGEQAYQRTGGGYSFRVEAATSEVAQLAPQAVEASHNLQRGEIVPLNRILQEGFSLHIPTQGDFDIFLGQKGISDPRYYDFLLANFSLLKAYGRAMNPQGVPRIAEAAEVHALNILSGTTSPQAYDAQVRRLLLEVKASQEAIKRAREGKGGETMDELIERLGLEAPQPDASRTEGPARTEQLRKEAPLGSQWIQQRRGVGQAIEGMLPEWFGRIYRTNPETGATETRTPPSTWREFLDGGGTVERVQ